MLVIPINLHYSKAQVRQMKKKSLKAFGKIHVKEHWNEADNTMLSSKKKY